MNRLVAVRIGMFNFHLLQSLFKLTMDEDLFPLDFTSLDVIINEIYLVIDMADGTKSGLYDGEEFEQTFAAPDKPDTHQFIEVTAK